MSRLNHTDDVNGIIIGSVTDAYEFWTHDGSKRLGKGSFENDAQAEAHCKESWPDEYRKGIEMRCFE